MAVFYNHSEIKRSKVTDHSEIGSLMLHLGSEISILNFLLWLCDVLKLQNN